MRKSTQKNNGKSMWQSFKVFLISIKGYRIPIILAVILTVGSAIFGLFIPKILGDMTTIAVNSYPDLDWTALGGNAILAIVLFCISAALNYAQAFILAVVSAKYTKEIREKILDVGLAPRNCGGSGAMILYIKKAKK